MKLLKIIVALIMLHFSITNLYHDSNFILLLCIVGVLLSVFIIYKSIEQDIKKIIKNGL